MRTLAVVLAGALLASGCASNSYRIPNNELERIARMAPEQRAGRVLVSQEISATTVNSAEPVGVHTEIHWHPHIHVSGHHHGGGHASGNGRIRDHRDSLGGGGGNVSGGRPSGGGKSGGKGIGGMKLGSGGGDGKGAAIAIVVLAAVALVAVASVEASRYDGWVELHPMHPVHLIGKDGSQTVMPLAWIDPQAAAWTEKAVVLPYEGPWRELGRHPLMRGGTYGMYGGAATSTSATGRTEWGTAFAIQGGYFPINQVGILANIQFSWRDNQFGGVLFDSRYSLELQALPLVAGRLHAGGYANVGLAYRWEDVPGTTIEGDQGSSAFGAGAMLQLDVHSRIALTARAGLVRAHGDRQTDMTFGLSVY